MKVLTSYISLVIVLMISAMLTMYLANRINETTNSIIQNIKYNSVRNHYVTIINNTKIIVINKTSKSNVSIIGEYQVLYNSTNILIIQSPLNEKITIVLEDDIIEV